jgi:hypothetical protein
LELDEAKAKEPLAGQPSKRAKEQRHMKLQHAMTWKSAGMMACGAVVALFSACGQDAGTDSSTASTDTASAYAALSASVQDCTDNKDECVTAAAGDATKLTACDAAAESCMQKTQGAQAECKRRLSADAQGCVKDHGRRGDSDGGVDESSRPDVHSCVERHAPSGTAPACMKDLFACLDKTGLKQSNAQTMLDAAAKDAIVACVQTAHTCFVTEMASHHRGGHGGAAGSAPHGAAGERADHRGQGDGGRPAFPGAEAGHESRHAGGAPSLPEGGRSGIGRGSRDSAGGAPAPGTRGRRDGAGGAGGN